MTTEEYVELYAGRRVMFVGRYPARIVGRTAYHFGGNQIIIEHDDERIGWKRTADESLLWLCKDADRGYIVDMAELELIEVKDNKPLPLPG